MQIVSRFLYGVDLHILMTVRRILTIVGFAFFTSVNYAHGHLSDDSGEAQTVIINGQQTVSKPLFVTQKFKQEQVNLALVQGIENYISSNAPEYLSFYRNNVSQEQLLERLDSLVSASRAEHESNNKQFTTYVRAQFKWSMLRQRLSVFSDVKRTDLEYRPKIGLVFVAREKQSQSQFISFKLPDTMLALMQAELSDKGYQLLSTYQFAELTGDRFNRQLLQTSFTETGEVNWKSVGDGMLMSTSSQDSVMMLVGSFEIEYLGVDDLSGAHMARVVANADAISPENYDIQASSSQSKRGEGTDKAQAINSALAKTAKAVSAQIANALYAKNDI